MKKIHNKWLIVLLALAMVLTVASSASAAAPDSIKTGFYVYDASKVGGFLLFIVHILIRQFQRF